MALQQQLIELADAIDLREIKNIKLANQLLKIRRAKKLEKAAELRDELSSGVSGTDNKTYARTFKLEYSPDAKAKIKEVIKDKKRKVINIIEEVHNGVLENNSGKPLSDEFELQINKIKNFSATV